MEEERFILPLPDMYPPVVYKYRDWNNNFHKRTVLNLELFLSSPSNFNDPFDCKIPIAYRLLKNNTEYKKIYFPIAVRRMFPKKMK
ncbi:MAG TPA: hypothetical protein VK809_05535 [Bacteroidia bacterium]|jgi:hypothetical protein|nr:hypothetical protein [Bacteroidia bacterium]